MTFDDGEEPCWCSLGKHHRFTTERSDLCSSNIECVAMMGKPWEINISLVSHQSIAQSGPVNE